MAIDGASRKQNSSFDLSSDSNSPGESNQTFMLNHETIRMESANKRAGSPISPPPLKPPSGHLTLLFTRSSTDKKLMDIPRRTKGFGLDPERERADGGSRREPTVCKFLGWVRRNAASFRAHLHAPSICGDNHLRLGSPDCPRLLRLTFLSV